MNKFITLILCLCCVFTSAWAEGDDHTSLNPSDANIVGHILDKKTGEHLSFINVYLHGTTIGTTTDATGHYYMKNLLTSASFWYIIGTTNEYFVIESSLGTGPVTLQQPA